MLNAVETVTLYSKRYDAEKKKTSWDKTVIRGCSWYGYQAVSVGEGLQSKDLYSVRIPSGSLPAGWLPKDAFLALPDPAGHWTVQNGDVVLLGEGPDVTGGITEITRRFTNCFTVTAVHEDNLKRRIPHLRLEGA